MPKRPYFLDFPCYIIVEGDDVGPHIVCVEGQTCFALFTDSECSASIYEPGARTGNCTVLCRPG